MSGFERPAPDLAKIVEAWQSWVERSESDQDEVLPGRTMADLKIGGTDLVLDAIAAETPDAVEGVHAAWNQWERGKAGPAQTLAALTEQGFSDIVSELVAV